MYGAGDGTHPIAVFPLHSLVGLIDTKALKGELG